MAPFASMKVRDAYSAGRGFMQGKIFGFIPMISEQGTPEMNAAALQRYLAEAVWYPSALLPGANLSWTELDNRRAVATLRDSKLEVSLEFDFTRNGEIDGVFSPGRYYYAGGKYELVPWGGYFRNYQEVDHVRIPMEAEVNWIYPERSFTYLRCTIPQIRFNQNVLKCEACCG
jgi:hypothetical protein